MTFRRVAFLLTLLAIFLVAGGFGRRVAASLGIAPPPQQSAQQPAPAPPQQSQTPAFPIKAETREVRVDVIVTDKKGKYIHDLKAKDFRVFEDNKEQPVNAFAWGADPQAPAETQRHYMVLFFDNSSMDLGDQPRARAAAGQFIDANAGPGRVMAVVNFGGSMQIVQNFTVDAERLKKAVASIQGSSVSPNSTASNDGGLQSQTAGNLSLGNAEGDFGAYTLLLSIRSLAKSLATVPGRKSLVLFTAGFALSPERFSELTATIDACNKANVAVYPLDVRGLVTAVSAIPSGRSHGGSSWASNHSLAAWQDRGERASAASPGLSLASFRVTSGAEMAYFQHSGGGGGGHGGGGGGGTGGGGTGGGGHGGGGTGGGGHGGTGGAPGGGRTGTPGGNTPYTQARTIVPPFPDTASTNQQVMYMLASGTGGFPIMNTNDLLSGLQKIASEQDEYYLLGYVPPSSADGSCHTLKVKVEVSGTNVRARSGYCNVKESDSLAGKPIEKELETRSSASVPVATDGTIEAPFFYTSANEARINLAMEIPSASIEFSKVKGKYHADVNILGIAYRPDGSVASRFSDELNLDFEKEEWQKFRQSPMHYENQFEIAPGKYRLAVVLSGGSEKFGKYETPLVIDPYDGKTFSLSGVAMSDQLQRVADSGGSLDADLLADRTPLLVKGMQLTPSGSNRFKKTDKVFIYAQIYAPKLADPNPPGLRAVYNVVDPKTGKPIFSSGAIDVAGYVQKGNSVVPLGLKIPFDNLPPGQYRVDVQAGEVGGLVSTVRSTNFILE